MENSQPEERASRIRFGQLPQGASRAVSSTFSSVTAGVGGMFVGGVSQRPDVADIASDEAFERYKEYNTKTQLRANEKHMWAGIAERVAGAILAGATFALGNNLLVAAEAASISPVLVGVGALAMIVGVSVGVFYTIRQSANREQSDKMMDVNDYSIKREATLIAQEIKKAIAKDGVAQSHSHMSEVIIVKEPANENEAPSQYLSSSAEERQLGSKVAAPHLAEVSRS